MNKPSELETKHSWMSDTAFGTLLCILSDTLFSVAYVFVQLINKVPGAAVSSDWTLCFKEWIAAAFALPIFLYLWSKGKASLPSWRVILMLLVAAFFCEYIGIGHHVTSYQFIGMALGLPIIRTITILGCTILGALLLREKITSLKMVTIGVLIGAVFMFGFCHPKPDEKAAEAPAAVAVVEQAAETPAETPAVQPVVEVAPETTPVAEAVQEVPAAKAKEPATPKYLGYDLAIDPFMFGFLCAFITGMGYAIYTLILRVVLKKANTATDKEGKPVQPVSVYFVVSTVFGFGGLCGAISLLSQNKWDCSAFVKVPTICWWYILGAGILTFFAFYFKNLSLRYATASKVATLSVVQVLLQVIFGILIFGEPTNALFWGGAVLTVVGILLASKTS